MKEACRHTGCTRGCYLVLEPLGIFGKVEREHLVTLLKSSRLGIPPLLHKFSKRCENASSVLIRREGELHLAHVMMGEHPCPMCKQALISAVAHSLDALAWWAFDVSRPPGILLCTWVGQIRGEAPRAMSLTAIMSEDEAASEFSMKWFRVPHIAGVDAWGGKGPRLSVRVNMMTKDGTDLGSEMMGALGTESEKAMRKAISEMRNAPGGEA